MRQGVVGPGRGGECAEGFRVAVHDIVAIQGECCDARREGEAIGRPRDESEWAACVPARRDAQPSDVWRAPSHTCGEPWQHLMERATAGGWPDVDQQGAQTSGAARDTHVHGGRISAENA
jgi:hypothetical protein